MVCRFVQASNYGMSKCPLDRCHDGIMEDIDLLPSYRTDLISLLIRMVYSASSSGDVATRLFQQKPGTQLFFFEKLRHRPCTLRGGPGFV
jgi:hypothetical protein